MLSAPTSTAPAASSRSISVASRGAGARSRLIFEPARVGKARRRRTGSSPRTARRRAGRRFSPAAIAASIARGLGARAIGGDVGEGIEHADRALAIRASAASVASSADSLRPATACAICCGRQPVDVHGHGDQAVVDTGRLGFVRQREFVDQPRQPQRHFEIGPHRRPPGLLDRQRQRLGDGVDVIVQRYRQPFRSSLNR